MASELRVNTIYDKNGDNSSTAEEINKGRAKAWVNFNGNGTVSIRQSYNVSSITDNATGHWTVNLSNALDYADYCAVASFSPENGTFPDMNLIFATPPGSTTAPRSTAFELLSYGQSAYRDCNYVCCAVFR